MPERYVSVYRLVDGRWTHRVVENEMPHENGPAYEKRQEAVTAATHLYPEDEIVVEPK